MMAIEELIKRKQPKDEEVIKTWKENEKSIEWHEGRWKRQDALIVSRPEEVQRDLLEWYHDAPTTRHPGIAQTYRALV